MINFTKPAVGLVLALFLQANFSLSAQNWGNFGSILSQTDSSKQNDYLHNLNTLQSGNLGAFDFGGVLDSLNNAISGSNPTTHVQNLLPLDSLVRDSLLGSLGIAGFSTPDSNSVISQFDSTLSVWNTRKDSLYGAFDQYQNQLHSGITLPDDFTSKPDSWRINIDSLLKNQDAAFQVSDANGLGNFKGVLDQLFDSKSFDRIEFNAGTQSAITEYYGQREQVMAPVVGLHSVEQFEGKWEARWRVQMSWFRNEKGIINPELVAQQSKDVNPFIMNGSFDIMYNPSLVDNAPMRLLTLLGIEAGTYAPAHRNPAIPRTLNNKGYTTGWGPVVGAGLSTKLGETTLYALGTIAFGDVICNPGSQASQYVYRSNRLEAGIRLANFITIRYENALSMNWANGGDKHVRYQQVTVGLPTTGLFR